MERINQVKMPIVSQTDIQINGSPIKIPALLFCRWTGLFRILYGNTKDLELLKTIL
jgi:hypothetical protein